MAPSGVFVCGATMLLLFGCRHAAPAVWPMHHIDRTLYNPNSLSPGDVNKDGLTDYAVIFEGPNKYKVVFHPGRTGDVRAPWPQVIIGEGHNLEYAALGDLDGDGHLDYVGVEGGDDPAKPSGVRVFWGPEAKSVMDPRAWTGGDYVPGSAGRMHYLSAEIRDINGDGAQDIVVGGRVHAGTKRTGLAWIEAPAEKSARRELAQWRIHDIDATLLGGHGFLFADVDQDGDNDVAVANADWNTPDDEEAVFWYENPGVGAPAQRAPWKRHEIYRGPEFYSKPQVDVADLDADGKTDLLVQSPDAIYLFKKTGLAPVTWTRIVIDKPAHIRWLPRPLKVADLDGDGRTDIVGMLIHDQGKLPAGKASVFWLAREGDDLRRWKTHVIRWADGSDSGEAYRGEKWDHARFTDVDGDGDVDIVANAEEHYLRKAGRVKETVVGVVWFENPQR